MKARPYVLSAEAENDLNDVYDYTVAEFGKRQAVSYLNQIEDRFFSLVINPELGRKRNEVRKGLRSLVHERHVIFYRVITEGIRIVRVMHGGRDIPRHF